ncbi:uncharacterized protein LOC128244676 [Mya arenaria]|uniref:uncharacterized protein LOC128244676 n=1 Tax=Mya arenaria TaxID=6604 RepID=UPI0022E7A806|nr:uncharacterized protein LOC128244676 [Mya arenaria]
MSRTNMAILTLLCFVVIVLEKFSLGQKSSEYQFSHIAMEIPEHMGRRTVRNKQLLVPHLYENDVIKASFCLEHKTTFEISNITYSNDGREDSVEVHLDGDLFGKFTSHGMSDWGKLWDVSQTTGTIGRTGMLDPGKHNITIKVVNSVDCHGIELWSMAISVYIPVDPSTFWCGTGHELRPKKWDCMSEEERQSAAAATLPSVTPNTQITTSTITTEPPNYVTVTQQSFTSDCLDKKNVHVLFTTHLLDGTSITAQQEASGSFSAPSTVETAFAPRYCDSDLWQIGTIDENNAEFASIYQGKLLKINITNAFKPETLFPAKLLPFVTTDIMLHFTMPTEIKMEKGSAYFALGLFNLTKNVNIGLRYFDHSKSAFTDFHVMTFTPRYQVMGWNIHHLGESYIRENTFHLHFETEANMIMFDFLKLQYNKRDERKLNTVIAREGHLKVRGLRYADSKGMEIYVNGIKGADNMEEALLLYQTGVFSRYETVVRIHESGIIYPYKTYLVNISDAHRLLIDVSGFRVSHGSDPTVALPPQPVKSVHVDTVIDEIAITYYDGSVLYISVTVNAFATKLQIIRFDTGKEQRQHHLLFTSTKASSQYAAVNTISTPAMTKDILENLDELNGQFDFTFRRRTDNLYYANNAINVHFPH